MDKLELVKKAATFIVGIGVGQVIRSVIENNVTPAERLPYKASMAVGSYVLGMMVAEHARAFADRKIDEAIDSWNENFSEKTGILL